MKKIVFPFSCKSVAVLTDKETVMKLSLRERFWKTAHLAICKSCQAYGHQSEVLQRVTDRIMQRPVAEKSLPEDVKLRILDALKK